MKYLHIAVCITHMIVTHVAGARCCDDLSDGQADRQHGQGLAWYYRRATAAAAYFHQGTTQWCCCAKPRGRAQQVEHLSLKLRLLFGLYRDMGAYIAYKTWQDITT